MKRVLIVLEGYINLSETNAICNDLLVKIQNNHKCFS